MDPVQILLFAIAIILTVLLVAVGIQVFLILRGAQKTLGKVDEILEDAGLISKSITRPVVGVVNVIESIKGIKRLIEFVSNSPEESKIKASDMIPEDKVEAPTHVYTPRQESVGSHIRAIQDRGRRFFHKGGKPLSS